MEQDSTTQPKDPEVGRILLERGIVTEAAVREMIALQQQMERENRPAPKLGELLIQKGYATAEQVRDALSKQNRKILYCPKCATTVDVDLRPGVPVHRCGRCQTPLIEPPAEQQKVVESTIMFIIKDPLPPEVSDRLQDPSAKFGKYIVVTEIGRGGVGVVYKSWDTYLGQYVALKRLKPIAAGPKSDTVREAHISSLLKEARSAIRLRHPHIATVYDVGRIGREFFMSMEFLEGRTLARDIGDARARGKLSPLYDAPRRYMRAMRDISRAVHYAHTRPSPVIHCDLKPSNVFLDTSDRAYVLDFGLARTLRDENPGSISGTPSYMAPEQAAGLTDDIDPRTDVYGLGAILYELLAGRPPFLGSVHSVLRKALSEMPERPQDLAALGQPSGANPNIPAGLEEICLRCLEKDRALRYQSAFEVADALEQIMKGDPRRRDTGTAVVPAPHLLTPAAIPAAPGPSLPPPAPFEPSKPGKSKQQVLMFAAGAAGAAILFLIAALALGLLGPKKRPPSPLPNTIVERVLVHAGHFRSDLALAETSQALSTTTDPNERRRLEALLDEFRWMEIARARLISSVNAGRPRLNEFALEGRALNDVEVTEATVDGLVLSTGQRPVRVDWSEIQARQILLLTERVAPSLLSAEKLGMALYAHRANLKERARELLNSLHGTELENVARKYQAEL
ncbi:MAG: protein kinase [Planctomycetes bacterium]|nr:protein kinase [Planctomycetota bacterium]